jgi:hypothetical protein
MRTLAFYGLMVGLAACSFPAPSTPAKSGEATPSQITTLASTAAPRMRLGRWHQVLNQDGQQATEAECLTSADLNEMISVLDPICSPADGFRHTSEGFVYENECVAEDGTERVHMVLNGDMQNHYVANITALGSGMPDSGQHRHIEGTYEGACRGDEGQGDQGP